MKLMRVVYIQYPTKQVSMYCITLRHEQPGIQVFDIQATIWSFFFCFCFVLDRNFEIWIVLWDAATCWCISPSSPELIPMCFTSSELTVVHCVHSSIIFTLFTYFCVWYHGPKKMSVKDSGEKKSMLSIEVKQEICKRKSWVWCTSAWTCRAV